MISRPLSGLSVARPPWATDKASLGSPATDRTCPWCRGLLEVTARRDSRFCSKTCRQAAFRLRRRAIGARDESPTAAVSDASGPLRFAYADPPYPGTAARYYGAEPSYRGEVDHASLIDRLATGNYHGWALSTSARALRDILPLCPSTARVCSWVKPKGIPPATRGLHNSWEPVIVVEGRKLQPGHADFLIAQAARGGGDLMGRKPIAFCAWLFQSLGMLPGDTLEDLFPGTGIVSAAWGELSLSAASDASLADPRATAGGAA